MVLARQGRAHLLSLLLLVTLAVFSAGDAGGQAPPAGQGPPEPGRRQPPGQGSSVTLFLCGDVMIGRGIDQALPNPGDPTIHEPYAQDARVYLRLAEQAGGPIPRPVDFSYIWGDALDELARMQPDLRAVNLETSITASEDLWPGKGINYRMHPDNLPCLTAAGIHYCALANNHVLDWGYRGLRETLQSLARGGIAFSGAGRSLQEAERPAVIELAGKGRVILASLGSASSGIPLGWAAGDGTPGVNLLGDLSGATVARVAAQWGRVKRAGDILVASIHWGGNWGYEVPAAHRRFARRLIEEAAVDVVHGHSSHHVRPLEVHQGKLILYGCGDFINDYEGIGGREEFRSDLRVMYFPRIEAGTGRLLELQITPLQVERFRLRRASAEDSRRLRDTLNRHGAAFGTRVILGQDGRLRLRLP